MAEKKTPLKSKAPKGLKVTRNGNTFTFSWTAGEKYKDVDLKVKVGYKITAKTKKKKATVKYITFKYKAKAEDWKANKVSITFPFKYKNATKKTKAKYVTPVASVSFTCRGIGSRKLTEKEKKKHNKLVESPYAKKWGVYKIDAPSQPSMTTEWNSTNVNQTKFSWSIANADKANTKWFTGHKWRIGWAAQPGHEKITWPVDRNKKAIWTSSTKATGEYNTPEPDLGQYTSFIRYVQVYSLGKRTNSIVTEKTHVYAKPLEPTDLKFREIKAVDGGTEVTFEWKHNANKWHPIDHTEVQYAVSPPAKGMSAPKNISGTKISQLGSKSATSTYMDSELQELDMTLNENECLFARVRFVHDSEENFSYWLRATELTGGLSNPVFNGLSLVRDNILNVAATNTAADAIEDSFLAISYKTVDSDLNSSPVMVIGLMPNADTDLDVRLPDDLGDADIQVIGLQAFAYAFSDDDFRVIDVAGMIAAMPGDTPAQKVTKVFEMLRPDLYIKNGDVYTKVTSQSYDSTATYCAHYGLETGATNTGKEYKIYTLPPMNKENSMQSDQLWEEGEFPKPPTEFNVVSADTNTTTADTATASWNWTWGQATAIELAWSSHADAWESTEEPTMYRVPVNRATSWNIKGLSAGTVWYIRARFVRVVGETETLGPWSKMATLNLTSAPVAPVLSLSRNIVTWEQDFVASWVYTSTDGSAQDLAEIYLVTVDGNGTRRGTYKPAIELLAKDTTVDPPVPIFDPNRTYYTLAEGVYSPVAAPVETDLDLYYLFDDASALVSTDRGSTTQQMTLNAKALGLEVGKSYQLSLRLKSKSTAISEWSPMVDLQIVEPLEPPVISAISQLTPDVVTDYISGDVYFITPDVTVSPNKSYFTLIGTEAEEPDIIELDSYYELSGDIFVKSTDTDIVPGKTYYFVDGTSVFEPVDEEIGTYYELPVTEEYRAHLALHALPIELNITGAGDFGTTMVTIERTTDFFTDKPDEGIDKGYEGEIVALIRQTGEGTITIDRGSLIGDLDDGAVYKMVVTVIDENGQTASSEYIRAAVSSAEDFARWKTILFTRVETEKPYVYLIVDDDAEYDPETVYYYPNEFTVSWDHQPVQPVATVTEVDNERYAITIQTGLPEGYTPRQDDTIDIYRLSVDKPQLIVQNGVAGESYVDPYPAFGEFGGHRIVYKTVYGDYIYDTPEGRLFSWIDLDEDDGDIIETPYSVLNFAEGTVEVLYNIDLSSSWKKDFKETKYLGGHVQGDWTPGVSRTGTINTVSVITQDQGTIKQMRRLADYAGIVHVRTRDGSSFAANVDVSETMSHDSFELASYSLSFTRVDAEGLDGMTLAEWNKLVAKEDS